MPNVAPNSYTVEMGKTQWTVPPRYQSFTSIGTHSHGLIGGALDTLTDNFVAIKKLPDIFHDEETTKKVLHEILLGKGMDHENVIGLLEIFIVHPAAEQGILDPTEAMDVFSDGSRKPGDVLDLYLVAPLMEADLENVLKVQEVSQEQVKFLIYQLLRGLKYLHSAGLVHQVLNPGHIGLNENCELRILSYNGLAHGAQDSRNTRPKKDMAFQAPETLLENFPVTEAADIWSVGCIMSQLLTGNPLFPNSDHINRLADMLKIMKKQCFQPEDKMPSDLPECVSPLKVKNFKNIFANVPEDARNFMEELLHLDPSKRLTAAEALAYKYLAEYHDVEDEPVRNPVDLKLQAGISHDQLKSQVLNSLFEFQNAKNEELLRRMFLKEGSCVTVNT